MADANGQLLTGVGISIGQVEQFRPGDVDAGDNLANRNTTFDPAGVFILDHTSMPLSNVLIDEHANWVAGIMISTSTVDGVGVDSANNQLANGIAPTGVATDASLHSSAFVTAGAGAGYEAALLTMQRIATINDNGLPTNDDIDDVRVINLSWNKSLPMSGNVVLDGNSLLTAGLDWSASKYDVLYIQAGNQGAMRPVPTDNFNGMTIARSTKSGGVYRQVSSGNTYNEDAVGPRTSIDLISPGDGVELTGRGDVHRIANGTSFAAPHVTGTVALLQQYGDERIMNSGNPAQWNTNGNARRHELMKAVLMNSADKIKDDENANDYGKYLGMERTVLKQLKPGQTAGQEDNWFDSDAYLDNGFLDTDTPLDEEMGAGHLNAKRALQQFIPGEQEISGNRFDPVSSYVGDVPVIGWDYGTISGTNFPLNKYLLDQPLQQGDFISITLAWDREVGFANDADMDGEFDIGDTFETYTNLDEQLTDLDLYLVPKGTFDIGDFDVGLSDSSVTPVEHLFTEIPFTGEYEIWVFRNEQFAAPQDYALAWWYGLAPDIVPPALSGDFDSDGDVDGADFLMWQRDTNVGSLADWESEFGMTGGPLVAANSTAVPEPATEMLLLEG